MPSLLAQSSESLKLSSEVNFDGSIKESTLSLPNASTAIAAHKAESIPPDKPRITPGKLFFST